MVHLKHLSPGRTGVRCDLRRQSELARFAPFLSVVAYMGNTAARRAAWPSQVASRERLPGVASHSVPTFDAVRPSSAPPRFGARGRGHSLCACLRERVPGYCNNHIPASSSACAVQARKHSDPASTGLYEVVHRKHLAMPSSESASCFKYCTACAQLCCALVFIRSYASLPLKQRST